MPGKFESNADQELAERLYSLTLEGFQEDDFGSVDEGGWYALVEDTTPEDDEWEPGEGGLYIVEQDPQGFFTIIFEAPDNRVVREHYERMRDEQEARKEWRP